MGNAAMRRVYKPLRFTAGQKGTLVIDLGLCLSNLPPSRAPRSSRDSYGPPC